MSLKIDSDKSWPEYKLYSDKQPEAYLYDKGIIVIVNTVYTFNLSKEPINLHLLAKYLSCAYNIKNKPCTIRLHPIRCTALVYSKGRAVIIGNQTHYTAIYSARIYTRMISRILNQPQITLFDFKEESIEELTHKQDIVIEDLFLKNITATINLPFKLDIDGFRKEHLANTKKGVAFPGLRFRLNGIEDKVVQILFKTGILITGAKSIQQIVDYYKKSLQFYQQHQLSQEAEEPKRKKQKKTISKEDKEHLDEILKELFVTN